MTTFHPGGGGTSLTSVNFGFTLAEAAEPRHHKGSWSKGFTLAEVLITLGIIGVVAALTIPTLVQNYQQRAWNTAATVFERKLEEALKTMNVKQTLAGYKDTETFVNELSKHLKITKICKNNDITSCFSDKIYWGKENGDIQEVEMADIKTSESFGQKDWDTNTVGVQFANGVNAVIAYNPECKQDPYSNQIKGSDCLAILYDTSGFKSPNTVNKDLRNNQNVNSLAGITGGFCLPDGTCFTAPFYPDAMSKADCEAEVAKGDLGINACYYDTDYWAGAVKACGGVDKMPTVAQLTALANELYDIPISGTSTEYEYANMDQQKALAMGFNLSLGTSGYFYVWSGAETSQYTSYVRYFDPPHTHYLMLNRVNSGLQAVCIAD